MACLAFKRPALLRNGSPSQPGPTVRWKLVKADTDDQQGTEHLNASLYFQGWKPTYKCLYCSFWNLRQRQFVGDYVQWYQRNNVVPKAKCSLSAVFILGSCKVCMLALVSGKELELHAMQPTCKNRGLLPNLSAVQKLTYVLLHHEWKVV